MSENNIDKDTALMIFRDIDKCVHPSLDLYDNRVFVLDRKKLEAIKRKYLATDVVKVRAIWEFEVDVSDLSPEYVDIEGHAKDMTQIELANLIVNDELSASDFSYEVVNNG